MSVVVDELVVRERGVELLLMVETFWENEW